MSFKVGAMTPAIDETGALRIERPVDGATRWLTAAAGLLCIIVPSWQVGFTFTDLNGWTIFFAGLVAGAWSIGIPLLIRAAFKDSEIWTLHDGELVVERSSPFRPRRTEVIRAAGITSIEIRPFEWDNRPDSYSVVFHLRAGGRLETSDYANRAKAELVHAEFRRRLRMG